MRIKTLSTTLKVIASVLTASIGGLSVGAVAYTSNKVEQQNNRYEQQQTVTNLYIKENEKLKKDISALEAKNL